MVVVAIVAVLWLGALGATLLARDTSVDVARALASDEPITRSDETQQDAQEQVARGA